MSVIMARVQQQFLRCSVRAHSSLATYHKRELPSSLIALSSIPGRLLFKESLADGGMESYFALSEQFVTQSEPSFCALSSLAMVLNALSYDPKKIWKGPWRWVSEETLQCDTVEICGHSLNKVKQDGMDFSEFQSLARCHDVPIQSFRASTAALTTSSTTPLTASDTVPAATNIDLFRSQIIQTSTSSLANSFIIVNFSRKYLGQTGDGHFSPIGGYHRAKDLVLVMDVARFKYPPFWVPLQTLYDSMTIIDTKTNQSRGYFILNSNNRTTNDDSRVPVEAVRHVHSSSCKH